MTLREFARRFIDPPRKYELAVTVSAQSDKSGRSTRIYLGDVDEYNLERAFFGRELSKRPYSEYNILDSEIYRWMVFPKLIVVVMNDEELLKHDATVE